MWSMWVDAKKGSAFEPREIETGAKGSVENRKVLNNSKKTGVTQCSAKARTHPERELRRWRRWTVDTKKDATLRSILKLMI